MAYLARRSFNHTNSLSTTPRAGRDRPNIFLRLIAWVLMATISTSSFAQAVGPAMQGVARGSNGQPYTGFTKNGTLVQGGVRVVNPATPSSLNEIFAEIVAWRP